MTKQDEIKDAISEIKEYQLNSGYERFIDVEPRIESLKKVDLNNELYKDEIQEIIDEAKTDVDTYVDEMGGTIVDDMSDEDFLESCVFD